MLNMKCKQAAEVSRRRIRAQEVPSHENAAKLQAAEAKMHELKANMAVLGKEAAAALAAVESQQHRLTFQRLVAMVLMQLSGHCAHFSLIFKFGINDPVHAF